MAQNPDEMRFTNRTITGFTLLGFPGRQIARRRQAEYLIEQRAKFDIFVGRTADALRKQYDVRIAAIELTGARDALLEFLKRRKDELVEEGLRERTLEIVKSRTISDPNDPHALCIEFDLQPRDPYIRFTIELPPDGETEP